MSPCVIIQHNYHHHVIGHPASLAPEKPLPDDYCHSSVFSCISSRDPRHMTTQKLYTYSGLPRSDNVGDILRPRLSWGSFGCFDCQRRVECVIKTKAVKWQLHFSNEVFSRVVGTLALVSV